MRQEIQTFTSHIQLVQVMSIKVWVSGAYSVNTANVKNALLLFFFKSLCLKLHINIKSTYYLF